MSYDDYDLAAAIKRIETSKDSHVRWAEHLVDDPGCCTPLPLYFQTREEHLDIIDGYYNVIKALHDLNYMRVSFGHDDALRDDL